MIYLLLAWTFFKIGLFSFGGGYVMIPLMEKEIAAHGWIAQREFADIVAVSQMTPGPIAVNAATYIGWRTAGIAGSAAATLGVFLPSFILVLIIARLMKRFDENRFIRGALSGVRPVTMGMIAAAVVFFLEMSVFTGRLPFRDFLSTGAADAALSGASEVFRVNIGGVIIFVVILAAARFAKLHPIAAVALSAGLGVLLM